MALLTNSICLMAKARLSPDPAMSADIPLPLIRSALPAALNTLGDRISRSPDRRLLTKEFDFSISGSTVVINGRTLATADMSAAFSAAEPLLLPADRATGYYAPFTACRISGNDAYFISDAQHLTTVQLDDGLTYYTTEAQLMYLAAATTPSGTVKVKGSFIPAVGLDGSGKEIIPNLPSSFQDDIVSALIEAFTNMRQAQAA